MFGFPPTLGGAGGGSVVRDLTGKDNLENLSGSTDADLVDEENNSERGGGGVLRTRNADHLDNDDEEWRGMTFAYCEEMGWVFLHHATKEGIDLVHELVR